MSGRFGSLDLTKVAVGQPTTCSVALTELILALVSLDDLQSLSRDLSEREDQLYSRLEERRSALEDQIKREVADKLGVDWEILDTAMS
jgi:hypothetical protein